MILQIHDELIFEVPKDDLKEISEEVIDVQMITCIKDSSN